MAEEQTEAVARFGIVVDADASSAETAADALVNLAAQLESDTKALTGMRRSMGALKGDTTASKDAITALQTEIDVQRIVIAQTQAKFLELGGSYREATDVAKAATEARKRADEDAARVAADAARVEAEAVRALAAERKAAAAQAADASRAATQLAANQELEAQSAALAGLSAAQLAEKIAQDTAALGAMQAALQRVTANASGTSPAIDQLTARIAAQKSGIAAAQNQFLNLGGDVTELGNSVGDAGAAFRTGGQDLFALAGSAQVLPGPLGAVVSRLSGVKSLLTGGGGIAAVIGLAAGFTALAAAAVAGAAALVSASIAASDARRNEQLTLQAIIASKGQDAQASKEAGLAASKMFSDIAQSSATSRADVEKYGEELLRAGLQGDQLQLATQAAATAAAALGDEGARGVLQQATALSRSGQAVDALAKKIDSELGGVAQERMDSLEVQATKLKESFGEIFSSLGIGPLLKGLRQVTDMFKASHATGAALQTLFSSLFGPFAADADKAGIVLKRFFQGMVLAVLDIGIWFQKVRIWFKNAFGDVAILKNLDAATVALTLGKVAVFAFAAALGAVGIAAAGAAIAIAGIMAPVIALGYAFFKAYQFVTEIKWGELGTSIVQGIANGVTSGAQWVIDAVKGLGTSAWTAFKSTLGIASPSKLFTLGGKFTAEGAAVGIEQGTPEVHKAAEEMAPKPKDSGFSFAFGRQPAPAAAAVAEPQATQPVGKRFGISLGTQPPPMREQQEQPAVRASLGFGRAFAGGLTFATQKQVAEQAPAVVGDAPSATLAPAIPAETPKSKPVTVTMAQQQAKGPLAPAQSPVQVTFGDINLAPGSTKEQAEDFRDQLVKLLEGVHIHMGAQS